MISEGSADPQCQRGCAGHKPAPPQVSTCATTPRRSALHASSPLDVGMEVHQEAIAVAEVAQKPAAEVIYLGSLGTRPGDLAPLSRTLPSQATPLVIVEAAGPCGSWLSRPLTPKGEACWVVAPAVMPTTAGDRGNTERRAAGPLARLLRSGELTPGSVPPGDDAASRALTRAREDARRALKAATCRLNACLLRQALRDPGRATWGPAHRRGLRELGCPTPAQPLVCQEDVRAVNAHTERLQRLAPALTEEGQTWRLPPGVEALQALRGVQGLGARTTGAERGDLTRVDTPRHWMKCWGLIPAASSRGARRQQGARTNAGTTQARRALVEGAWTSRAPANVSRPRQLRLAQPPTVIPDLSWKAQVRLCQRDRRLLARGQHANHVVVAIARELAGFIWAIATQVPVRP
jgi:transposase